MTTLLHFAILTVSHSLFYAITLYRVILSYFSSFPPLHRRSLFLKNTYAHETKNGLAQKRKIFFLFLTRLVTRFRLKHFIHRFFSVQRPPPPRKKCHSVRSFIITDVENREHTYLTTPYNFKRVDPLVFFLLQLAVSTLVVYLL